MVAARRSGISARTNSHARNRFRSVFTVFRRVNLPFMGTARSIAVVVGLGLGAAALLANLILYDSIALPFRALDDHIATVAPHARIIRSTIGNWLPESDFRRVLPSMEPVPVSGGFAELGAARTRRAGALVLGSDCRIERLLGPIGCAKHLGQVRSRAARGETLYLSRRLAGELRVREGNVIHFPGGQSTLVAGVLEDRGFDRINDGYVALAPAPVVSELFGHPGSVSAIYLTKANPRDVAALQRELGNRVQITTPSGRTRYLVPTLENLRRFVLVFGIAASVTGVFLGASTFLLGAVERRRVLATLTAIGSEPSLITITYLLEGALLGVLAPTVAIPVGLVTGWILVSTYTAGLLDGSGVHLAFSAAPRLLVFTALVTVVLGMLAAVPPLVAVLRERTSDALTLDIPRERIGKIHSRWAGVTLAGLGASLLVMRSVGRGEVPVTAIFFASALYSASTALTTVILAPLLAGVLARRVIPFSNSRLALVRLLTESSLTRSPMRTGFTVTVLALGISLVFGVGSILHSAERSYVANAASVSPRRLVITGREVGEPTAPSLSASLIRTMRSDARIKTVTAVSFFTLDNDTGVMAMEATPHVTQVIGGTGLSARDQERVLEKGEVILSRLLAGQLDAGPGDSITLPSLHGLATLRVGGVGTLLYGEDGVGKVVVTSLSTARRLWGAQPTSAVVEPAAGTSVSLLARTLPRPGRVHVHDAKGAASAAGSFTRQVFTPLVAAGWTACLIAVLGVLNMLVLGLMSRRQERGALRAIGLSTEQELATVVGDALVVGGLGAFFGVAGGVLFTAGIVAAGPALFAITPTLHVSPTDVLVALAVSLGAALLGAVFPVIHAGRFSPAAALHLD